MNIDAANKLFKATVASTVLYVSVIWGLKHAPDVEKIQVLFYKRLLMLPNHTPGYVIRLETGSTRLEADIAKRALKFRQKILNMHSDRYPKRLYTKLKELNTATTPSHAKRLNWFSLLQALLKRADHEYLV